MNEIMRRGEKNEKRKKKESDIQGKFEEANNRKYKNKRKKEKTRKKWRNEGNIVLEAKTNRRK
jgi:hypothetical protein